MFSTGSSGEFILPGVLRHTLLLHKIRIAVRAGKALQAAVDSMVAPTLPFTIKNNIVGQARDWDEDRLKRVIVMLREAMLRVRIETRLSDILTVKALISIASMRPRQATQS